MLVVLVRVLGGGGVHIYTTHHVAIGQFLQFAVMVDPEEKAFLESLKEFMNSNRYLKAKQQKLSFFESKTACHFVEGFALQAWVSEHIGH